MNALRTEHHVHDLIEAIEQAGHETLFRGVNFGQYLPADIKRDADMLGISECSPTQRSRQVLEALWGVILWPGRMLF